MKNLMGTFSIVIGAVAVFAALLLFIFIRGNGFTAAAEDELRAFFSDAMKNPAPARNVTKNDWQTLPAPVQNYLSLALKEGVAYRATARVRLKGVYRLTPGGGPMDFAAEEYFDTRVPGFIWFGKTKLSQVLWTVGLERYRAGAGSYVLRTLGAVNETAASVTPDTSSLARYLAEAVWFPAAFLPEGAVQWEAVDATHARAVITDGGATASAFFSFGNGGMADSAVSDDRSGEQAGTTGKKRKWTMRYSEYKEFGGAKIPTLARGEWDMNGAPFEYARFNVLEAEYDMPERFPPPKIQEPGHHPLD